MDLYEIEGKRLLECAGIPVERHALLTDQLDCETLYYPCVLKAQSLSGKRGKAGGIRVVQSPDDLREAHRAIRGLVIGGRPVAGVMVSEALDIAHEYYLGITLDTVNKQAVLIFSPAGGMDIEQVAAEQPRKLVRIDCTGGFDTAGFVSAVESLGLGAGQIDGIADIAGKLVTLFFETDATTAEINPLAACADGRLVAADAKVVIDDNALFRRGNFVIIPRDDTASQGAFQRRAKAADLTYVEVDRTGNIGLIAGGAGIGMATVDTIKHYGGRPFNFLDLGGGVTAKKTCAAMGLLLDNPQVEHILVNIFGGINNCLDMATGIAQAVEASPAKKPLVVKSRGYNQEEGWAIFARIGARQVRYGTTDEAVKLLLAEVQS